MPPASHCSNFRWAPSGWRYLESLCRRSRRLASCSIPLWLRIPDCHLRSIQQGALTHAIEPSAMPVDDESGVERSLYALGQQPDSGLIVLQDAFTVQHRNLVIDQVARHRIPAVYTVRLYPESGGLVSYGVDFANQFRQAAIYVDLMLKGAKLGELPVQQPTKFELVLNLKIAKALGIEITPSLLVRADEVIE